MTDLLLATLKRRDQLEPTCTTYFSELIKWSHMHLISIIHTHSQKLPLAEGTGEGHRTAAQWCIGRRPGIPVAGVTPEIEQNGESGKNIYNNPDENKVLSYCFIWVFIYYWGQEQQWKLWSKDHSLVKAVLWRLVMSCTYLKTAFKLTQCTLICRTVIHFVPTRCCFISYWQLHGISISLHSIKRLL